MTYITSANQPLVICFVLRSGTLQFYQFSLFLTIKPIFRLQSCADQDEFEELNHGILS